MSDQAYWIGVWVSLGVTVRGCGCQLLFGACGCRRGIRLPWRQPWLDAKCVAAASKHAAVVIPGSLALQSHAAPGILGGGGVHQCVRSGSEAQGQACAGRQASCAAASHARAVCVCLPARMRSSRRHEAPCMFLLAVGWVPAHTMGQCTCIWQQCCCSSACGVAWAGRCTVSCVVVVCVSAVMSDKAAVLQCVTGAGLCFARLPAHALA